jgi:phosphinothricin acetyltransferase
VTLTIRRATTADLAAITEIYNHVVINTTATFDTQTKTLEERESWFAKHGEKYPILVAEDDNHIIGWASLSRWSDRLAYADTAEISLYVRDDQKGKGIGRRLMTAILDEGRRARLHVVIARIVEGNDLSIYLHESAGFWQVGIMKEVGRKFGKLLDINVMQIILQDEQITTTEQEEKSKLNPA